MSQSELTTAKYFEQAERERAAAAEAAAAAAAAELAQAPPPQPSSADRWASAYRWLSVGIAVAAVGCMLALAVPYFTSAGPWQRRNPIDWMLWFGGARSDQTFEKYLRDTMEANQREWDERYRESPAYQFNSTQFNIESLNLSQQGWRPDPSPRPRSK